MRTLIFIIILILALFYCNNKNSYEAIEIDGTVYKVNKTYSGESAKVLNKLNNLAIDLITLLRKRCEKINPNKITENEKALLSLYNYLRKRYNPDVLFEHVKKYYKDATSFSYNKGEKLVMCIRDNNGKLHEECVVVMVLIHELAHIGGPDWQHGKPFWLRYELLCDLVAQAGWFKNINKPLEKICYCGKINIPPSEFNKIITPTFMV